MVPSRVTADVTDIETHDAKNNTREYTKPPLRIEDIRNNFTYRLNDLNRISNELSNAIESNDAKEIVKVINKYITLIGVSLFLMYPFFDMAGAGWIATTLNYLWCFVFAMISFIPLINEIKSEWQNYLISCFDVLLNLIPYF